MIIAYNNGEDGRAPLFLGRSKRRRR